MWGAPAHRDHAAEPSQVWRRYADVAGWPEWHHVVQRASIGGLFAEGAEGTLKLVGGPLSWLSARVVGRKVAAGLPTAMSRLAALAERS